MIMGSAVCQTQGSRRPRRQWMDTEADDQHRKDRVVPDRKPYPGRTRGRKRGRSSQWQNLIFVQYHAIVVAVAVAVASKNSLPN